MTAGWPRSGGGKAVWTRVLPRFVGLLLWLALTGAVPCRGQAAGTSGAVASAGSAKPYVLHVYEDLVQVPTMVLTPAHETDRGLAAKQFEVQIDRGPKFHPQQARPEGDDPLSFSLLLDARRGEHEDLVRGMAAALGQMPAGALQPQDHVSVFAYDCTLVSSGVNVAYTAEALQTGVRAALRAPGLHGVADGKRTRCSRPAHLWDAIFGVIEQVRSLPGRRVLLVVSDGQDFGSKVTPEMARVAAGDAGLAIFAIRPDVPQESALGPGVPNKLALETMVNDPLGLVCGGSGGLVAGATTQDLDRTLERLFALVRGRYILEFPRPGKGLAAARTLYVTVGDTSAIVRQSGVTMGLQDPAQEKDANTVHGGLSP